MQALSVHRPAVMLDALHTIMFVLPCELSNPNGLPTSAVASNSKGTASVEHLQLSRHQQACGLLSCWRLLKTDLVLCHSHCAQPPAAQQWRCAEQAPARKKILHRLPACNTTNNATQKMNHPAFDIATLEPTNMLNPDKCVIALCTYATYV